MPIMFAITVVAFVALLWAAISTAQHVRRARRRKRLALKAAGGTRGFHQDDQDVSTRVEEPSRMTTAWSPEPTAAAPPPPPPPPPQAATPTPFVHGPERVRFPLSSQRARLAESPASTASEVSPAAFAAAEEAPSPEPEPAVPLYNAPFAPPKRPPVSVPPRRPDWAYFKEDMGDLSDPAPPPRYRDRTR